MNSKILLFSDLHLNNWGFSSSLNSSGCNSRLLDGLKIIKKVYLEAHTRDISTIVFGGDLFHLRQGVPTDVVDMAYRTIEWCSKTYPNIKLVLLIGNHDLTRNLEFSPVNWFARIPRVTVVSSPIRSSGIIPGIDCLFIPYTPHHEKFEKLIKEGGYTAVFCHQGFSDLLINPHNYYIDEIASVEKMASWVGEFDSVDIVSGHYHDHNLLTGTDKDLLNLFGFFIGAPMQHSFKDVGCRRGFVIYDIGSRKPEFHELKSFTPIFLDVTESTILSRSLVKNQFIRVSASSRQMDSLVNSVEVLNPLGISKNYIVLDSQSSFSTKDFTRTNNFDVRAQVEEFVMNNSGGISVSSLMDSFDVLLDS